MATVAGVPGGALLGAVLGWRATFWAIAVICLPVAAGVLAGIPDRLRTTDLDARPHLGRELAQLRRPRLLVVILLAALVNTATFGSFTFLAPLVTRTAGLAPLWVPVVLVLFGAGSFAGVRVAGRLSDNRAGTVIAVAGPLLCAGWFALGATADRPVALLVLVCLQGALSFAVGSTLITRILYEAAAPTMAGSYATVALNLGAAAGPVVAALALDTGAAERGPIWVSAVLAATAMLAALKWRPVFTAGPDPVPVDR